MTSPAEFIHAVCKALESAGIAYMIAGSVASSLHGPPRSTNDVDIIIAATGAQLDALLAILSEFYVSANAAHDALRRRSMFNVIDPSSGNKADLIVLKDRPFSETELNRRVSIPFAGQNVYVATPEDMILSKLEWSKLCESERQFRDAANVALTKWPDLDISYLQKWAVQLDVVDALNELLKQVREIVPQQLGKSSTP